MVAYLVDRRDVDFVLHEQLRIETLTQFERFRESRRADFDMVLNEAVRFAQNVLNPINSLGDVEGCRLEDGTVKWPAAFHKAYEQLLAGGWTATVHSPEYGGMGLPMPLGVALSEIFIGGCSSFMFLPGLTSSAGHLLEAFASPALRDLVVPRMYSGDWAGTMCLTEPQAGSDVGALTTTAVAVPNKPGVYKIKGSKIFISAGDNDITSNVIHLVLARVPGDPAGTKGISLFAVPKYRFDTPAQTKEPNDVTVTAIEHKMGIHASPTCALAFGENDDCEGYLIGERCQGMPYMFQMMNEARIECGLQGSASANSSYQLALAYAKERVQGSKTTAPQQGRVAIVEHPDVRRNLMLAKCLAEGIRALLFKAAMYGEYARSHDDANERARCKDMLELLTPVCKAFATDMGFRVTELAIQVHGGYGYVAEYGVEQSMRDVKIASIYEGTNGIQALDLLGRKMRLKDGALFMTWMAERNQLIEQHKDHPRLQKLVQAVDRAKNSLAQAAMNLAQRSAQDMELALLGATPFLEMFGHVELGFLLLEQAIIADAKLAEIVAEAKVETDTERSKLLNSHSDARFYDAKVKSAQFYSTALLPRVRSIGDELQAGDRSALDVLL